MISIKCLILIDLIYFCYYLSLVIYDLVLFDELESNFNKYNLAWFYIIISCQSIFLILELIFWIGILLSKNNFYCVSLFIIQIVYHFLIIWFSIFIQIMNFQKINQNYINDSIFLHFFPSLIYFLVIINPKNKNSRTKTL